MENVIIILILVILMTIGIHSSIKHFKGEGGCCGGGSAVKKKQKKLKAVVAKKVVMVEGMTCEHCKSRVERSIDDIDGAAAKVNLKKKEAVISLEKEISNEQIREAIEKSGYIVIGIQDIQL